MTEYGRGTGSQPWHPEDPLYGDQGWDGQQATSGHGPYDSGQYPQYPQQQMPQHPQQQHPQQQQQQWDDGYGAPYQQQPQQQYNWDGTPVNAMGYGDPNDPYGGAADPYGGQQPDYYGDPGGYPQQQPQQHPQQQQQQTGHQQPYQGQQYAPEPQYREPEPEEPGGWDPGPNDREHAFFANDPDRDDEDDSRSGGRDKKQRKPKRRSGMACLVVAVVLTGAVGGAGYFGYQFWQEHFGPAPDFTGSGSGQVQVEIPAGAGTAEMGGILEKAGVVKSAGAFVEAASDNPKGSAIQAGVYSLKKRMSGASAVQLMTDPASRNTLTIPEGWRTSQIYAAVDKKLDAKAGTTAKAAKTADLGLPAWAKGEGVKDPNEGFLFPAQYGVKEGMKPEDVLRQMVKRAEKEYAAYDLEAEAKKLKLDSPRQVLAVASLVQAEGKHKADFEKVARVVYNRLKPGNPETNGKLDFDSTYNYAKNQSTLDLPSPSVLRQFDDPYNTYHHPGLPPGPIGNPGVEALKATLDPAKGNWYFFVSISSDNTVFAETYEEHQRNVARYNEKQAGQ